MKRTLLSALAIVATALIGSPTSTAQSTDIDSGGIGLSRDVWEAIYGEGEALQSLVRYETPEEGFPVYVGFVGFEDDRVAHIEFRYSEGTQLGGLAEADATAQIEAALPTDAELIDAFFVPATPEGPVSLRAQRWESDSLGDVTGAGTSILVIYQETMAQQNPGSDPQVVIPAVTLTIPNPA
jgi:hypothetical protein